MSMTLIEHIEVDASLPASIVFSSIPQTYTDLYLVVSARINRASTNDDLYVRLNGSSLNYTARRLYGRNTVSTDTVNSQSLLNANSTTANTFGSTQIYIPNYTSSNYKSMSGDGVTENNASGTGDAYQVISATLWSDTSAVTSITLESDEDFRQYSSATLFGITAGSDGTTTVS